MNKFDRFNKRLAPTALFGRFGFRILERYAEYNLNFFEVWT